MSSDKQVIINEHKVINGPKMERFTMLLERAQYGVKQYQHDGVEWCVRNELQQTSSKGGIIADEMGLGKTLMMIGVMFVNLKKRTLIVLPPVLLEQWVAEIYKCSGHIPIVYHGQNVKTITDEELARAPIVLTTYSMLNPKKNTEIANTRLHKIIWNRIIFDEAHHLRNKKTTRYKSCKALRAKIRWLVTGTPVQNKRNDFFNLCNIIGIKVDRDNFAEVIQNNVLRRTKTDVGIMLPPVLNHCQTINWANIHEKRLAEEIHSCLPNQTYVTGVNCNGLLASKLHEKGVLLAILRARQSCILPALIKPSTKGLKEPEYKQGTKYSSKLDCVLQTILDRKDNGNGKIIFCNFRQEIDFVAERLRQGGMQKVVTFDGRNSKNGLKTLSDAADAIVLQIQTGCEGLNLQKNYSEIYFISPHWNPSIEDQAVARCHRIGQQKPTNVFKFEMDGFDKPIQQGTQRQEQKNQDQDQDQETPDPITLEKYVNKVQQMKREISSAFIKHN
jgi:SNF2 family DNA or RNA helicase